MTCTFPPRTRLRRLREQSARREHPRVFLEPRQMILPLFVVPGSGKRTPISGLTAWTTERGPALRGCGRSAHSRSAIVHALRPSHGKDANGSTAWRDDQPVQQALRFLKERYGRQIQLSPTSACASTPTTATAASSPPTGVDNDTSAAALGRIALSHVRAGRHGRSLGDDGRTGCRHQESARRRRVSGRRPS